VPDNFDYSFTQYLVTARLISTYKGKAETQTITILTGLGGGDCGYYFSVNKEYLIYGREGLFNILDNSGLKPVISQRKYYTTTICDRTTADINKELPLLKAAMAYRPPAIQSLVGTEHLTSVHKIFYKGDSLVNGGGYRLPEYSSPYEFGISYWASPSSWFYFFVKYPRGSNSKHGIIVDILEIPKHDLTNKKYVDGSCETIESLDPEIIALVKAKGNPEFYNKIIKAWKANRMTEKFEIYKKKKVKKCGNEGYGV
jgi:hypothetical protein